MNEITPVEAGGGIVSLGALGLALRWARKFIPARVAADAAAKATLAILGDPGAETPEDGTMAKLVKEAGDAARVAAAAASAAAQEARLASENNTGALEQLSEQVNALSMQSRHASDAQLLQLGGLKEKLDGLEKRMAASEASVAGLRAETAAHVSTLHSRIADTQKLWGKVRERAATPTPVTSPGRVGE